MTLFFTLLVNKNKEKKDMFSNNDLGSLSQLPNNFNFTTMNQLRG